MFSDNEIKVIREEQQKIINLLARTAELLGMLQTSDSETNKIVMQLTECVERLDKKLKLLADGHLALERSVKLSESLIESVMKRVANIDNRLKRVEQS